MSIGKKKPVASQPADKRVMIVDDHPIMRMGMTQLISNEPGLSVCSEAENAAQGLEAALRLKPDLILMDISLPDKSGLELIKDILAAEPKIAILVLSMHDEALYAERVLRAGGRGYIMKQEGGQKLKVAMRQVLEGQIYVSEKISGRILEAFSGKRHEKSLTIVDKLTDREFEVFELIGKGKTTREIATMLHLSGKTVEVHRLNIKNKLEIMSPSELIRAAVRWVESQEVG